MAFQPVPRRIHWYAMAGTHPVVSYAVPPFWLTWKASVSPARTATWMAGNGTPPPAGTTWYPEAGQRLTPFRTTLTRTPSAPEPVAAVMSPRAEVTVTV